MTRHQLAWMFLAVLSLLTSHLSAGETDLEVVEGLRKGGKFDEALKYLEAAETRPDLPADVKVIIPFEKATTLTQWAKVERNLETAAAQLDRAQRLLEQFLKANPDHPQAAKASSDTANILVTKGKVAVVQSKSPDFDHRREYLLKQAQQNYDEARKQFQAALNKYDKEWQSYGPFIDPAREPGKREAKELAERMRIRAKLDLAIVEYEAAQVYEKEDPQRQKNIQKASDDFGQIHQEHRSQVAGLYARMYQAKCFEELGDVQKALGLYNELLTHNPESSTMRNLQAQVTHFKLICLNSAEQSNWGLVKRIANDWIAANPTLLETRYAVGIRFELARALEKLAQGSQNADEKRREMVDALAVARIVNRAGGEHRDAAQAMMTRLMEELNLGRAELQDFDNAYGLARQLVNSIKQVKDAMMAAKDPETAQKRKQEFISHLEQTSRALNAALSLREPNTPLKEINLCRYSLCYVYYEQRRSYDAAVLGEWVARRYANDTQNDMGSLPADSAYLAMAAYAQAYNVKGNPDRQTDIRRLVSISKFIIAKWPGSPKAIDAQMMLGQMYVQIREFLKAVEALEKLPSDSAQYWKGQVTLGQALWEATVEGLSKPQGERPPSATLADYQSRARDILKRALAHLEPKLAENESLPDELVAVKLTLAQIANQTGQFAEALQLLETDRRSVLSAIAIREGETRPATGVKSDKFAQEVQKQLTQARAGLGNGRK